MERQPIVKLAELSSRSRARLNELAQREGISLPRFQRLVLSIVQRFPDQHQQVILHRDGWDKGQVARAFRELEQQGLIRRCGSSTTKRITQVALTPEGEALAERLAAIRTELAATLLAGWTPEEVARFDDLLDRALDNMTEPSTV
ncbi:MarR family winged helix-turn-helix transcriptional regulator [Salinicola aestuarinus]|uniref:MarR family winged helix-turn-helix transcriptional regulator n=1 Tax=Salinicola aestuarinus TaxID=1949082 RepID=UPI000DA15E16|nr:MarR family winged helix-turn-helix transcriptional regulator [Salinicola aestuarinus]